MAVMRMIVLSEFTCTLSTSESMFVQREELFCCFEGCQNWGWAKSLDRFLRLTNQVTGVQVMQLILGISTVFFFSASSDQCLDIMKVASFNIQRFGIEKLSDPFVLKTLIKIVSCYDIIVILEVVDSSGESMDHFLKELNKFNNDMKYKMEISPRLGRGKYKEQFMFLYRDKEVALNDFYQYPDKRPGNEDAFAREPYAVRFKCHNTVLKNLVLIPVHTNPKDAKKELEELYNVFLAVKEKFQTNNIMILGDFNADGRYLSDEEMKTIPIRSDKNFHWLISDDEDTTASTTNDNTYDRIVVYGVYMKNAVVPKSAKPFNFQKAYKLKDEDVKRVSDHYPVEVELKRKR